MYQHFDCKFEALGVEIEGWHSYEKRFATPILWGTGRKKISKKSHHFCAILQNPKMQKIRKNFEKCIFPKFDNASLKPTFQEVSVPKISLISAFKAKLLTKRNPPKLIFSIFAPTAEPIKLLKKQKLF